MERPTRKYLVLIALAVIVFHWKTLLTNQYTTLVGSEGVNQTYAWLHFWLRSVWHSVLPLWDPYVFAGRPFAGETQTTAYYPLRLLFALVPFNRNDVVSPRFYHEYLAFVRFCGACFMFAFLRELGRSRFAAFIGACAFSMGGLLGRLPWPQHMEACTWLPAILLFIARSFRVDNSHRRAVMETSLAGLCLGLSILSGGVQFAMMEGIGAVIAILYLGLIRRYSTRTLVNPRRIALVLTALIVTAAAVASVQLVSSFEYGHQALRFIKGGWFPMSQKIPYDRMDGGMGPQALLNGLFPVGGGPTAGESWPYYVGALPFFLAMWAVWRCREGVWVRFFVGLAVFGFVYALGEFSPLNGLLYATVPYLWNNREPSRFLYLTSFSLAALASFGLDNLLTRGSDTAMWSTAKPILKWVGIVAAVGMVLPGVISQATLGVWTYFSLVFILTSCACLFYLMRQSPSPSARFLLTAFLLFDLGVFNWNAAGSAEVAQSGDQYQQMLTLKSPVNFIQSLPGLNRVRVVANPEPNVGDVYGIQSVWGGGVTVLKNYSLVSQRESLLNVRYRIKPASSPDTGAIYEDKHWKVYKDDAAYPRAWVVHRIVVVNPNDNIFIQADKLHLDLHTVGLMESALPRALNPAGPDDSIRFTSYSANSMSLDVNAGGSGLLVLSEIFYPGWKATVNGQNVEIHKVDGGLRGVLVEGGTSHVLLTYAPKSIYISAVVSLMTMIVCLCFGLGLWRTRPAGTTAV